MFTIQNNQSSDDQFFPSDLNFDLSLSLVNSSRSHLLFMIKLEGQDRSSGSVSTGTLTLCDLAGSERVGKTEATGQRLVEAAAINKSLTALGQVRIKTEIKSLICILLYIRAHFCFDSHGRTCIFKKYYRLIANSQAITWQECYTPRDAFFYIFI